MSKEFLLKKEGKTIETNTYIMTFNTPKIPEKIKVGYSMEKVEQFVPNPLRCYRCQKYGHHEDSCRGYEVCEKCGQRDPDHHMNVNFPINVRIVVVTIRSTQDLATFGGEKKRS